MLLTSVDRVENIRVITASVRGLRWLLILLPAIAGAEWKHGGERDIVTLLTYNVENLFDSKDHPRRQDETFLPLTEKNNDAHRARCASLKKKSWQRSCLKLDWGQEQVEAKVLALAQVIVAAGAADILVLQEVENRRVLKMLTSQLNELLPEGVAKYGTQVLHEGGDRRGINQAVLSRFPTHGRARLHRTKALPARGLLEVPLRLPGGTRLRVFAVHLPARYYDEIDGRLRLDALQSLFVVVNLKRRKDLTVIAGDFNLNRQDDETPSFANRLKHWYQTHWHHCRGGCRGTSYYGGKSGRGWSWLDRVLLLPSMAPEGAACWRLKRGSVRIMRIATEIPPGQVTGGGYPRSFSTHSGRGASDHLPVRITLEGHC